METHWSAPDTDMFIYRSKNNGSWQNWKRVASREWVTAQGYLTAIPTLQQVTAAGNETTIPLGLRSDVFFGPASRLWIDTQGNIQPGNTNTRSAGLYGNYDHTKIAHIWSIGTAFKIADDGSTFGGNGGNGLYGIAYVYQSHALAPMSGGGHQYVFADNGTPNAGISSTDGRFWALVVASRYDLFLIIHLPFILECKLCFGKR